MNCEEFFFIGISADSEISKSILLEATKALVKDIQKYMEIF